MPEKSIIFSTPMVQAILVGRKTQTRRVVKPQPAFTIPLGFCKSSTEKGNVGKYGFGLHEEGGKIEHRKPLYLIGDVLWVRETWLPELGRYYYRADIDSDYLDLCETLSGGYPDECRYYPGCEGCTRTSSKLIWRPSIHMPRSAARLLLQVTDVRVERVQEISEDDAIAEGFMAIQCDCKKQTYYETCPECMGTGYLPTHYVFAEYWDALYDKGGYGWEANPWVWVIEFERLEARG